MSLKNIWMAEPVAIGVAIRALILCGMAFGLHVTVEQLAAVMVAVESVLALFTRGSVNTKATTDAAVSSAPATVSRMSGVAMMLIIMMLSMGAISCASAPPNLTPAAQTAWNAHEAQKDLDLVRDIAQDASDAMPPVLSVDAARQVTLWHTTAIRLIHDQPAGWRVEILTGLDALRTNLVPADYAVIAKYVTLARGVLQGVP